MKIHIQCYEIQSKIIFHRKIQKIENILIQRTTLSPTRCHKAIHNLNAFLFLHIINMYNRLNINNVLIMLQRWKAYN
jgi:hypothetical protein